MSEQNRALARRVVEELWDQGELETADELHSSSYLLHQHEDLRGPDARSSSTSSRCGRTSLTSGSPLTTKALEMPEARSAPAGPICQSLTASLALSAEPTDGLAWPEGRAPAGPLRPRWR